MFLNVLLDYHANWGQSGGLESSLGYQRFEWKSIIQFYAQIHPVTAACCCCQLRAPPATTAAAAAADHSRLTRRVLFNTGYSHGHHSIDSQSDRVGD